MDGIRVLLPLVGMKTNERISRCFHIPRFESFEIALVADRIISLVVVHQNRVAKTKQENKNYAGLGRYCLRDRGLRAFGRDVIFQKAVVPISSVHSWSFGRCVVRYGNVYRER